LLSGASRAPTLRHGRLGAGLMRQTRAALTPDEKCNYKMFVERMTG
jgi:hypothetical protein